MKKTMQFMNKCKEKLEYFFDNLGLGMRKKLVIIFLLVKVIPLILLTIIAWQHITMQGNTLREIAINDSTIALNDSAVKNIERISTDTAQKVADFLYMRDNDILFVAKLPRSENSYKQFIDSHTGRLISKRTWKLSSDGKSWVPEKQLNLHEPKILSTNNENRDMNSFNHREPNFFEYEIRPLYDEITFIDLEGNEIIKIVANNSPKSNFPMSSQRKNVADKANTYIKAETYFPNLKQLKPGEIYVSDMIGAYVGSNYIGMYTPDAVAKAAQKNNCEIEYNPEKQAYAGRENPNGKRFEGIIRWATTVTDENNKVIGYVTLALNHDHIMEFINHITPLNERYTELPSAHEGNYAFICDYKCRNIGHPRHHSIVGFDPETGEPQVPWLEESIYEGWQQSGLPKWTDYIKDYPAFHEQTRTKKPAATLTQKGLVGLDGRYLNNAPQCTGWMNLTRDGGSGSFYMMWSQVYKINTVAAIPYYTGQYAPSAANQYSKRGFGFVALGSNLEDFTSPANRTEEKLVTAINENLKDTFFQLGATTIILIILVVFIAIWMASAFTNRIKHLINGISRFRSGERQFRFNSQVRDEMGILADSLDEMAESIVNSVNNPLTIIDTNYNIIYMNEQELAYINKTLPEVVGRPYSENSIYPGESKYCPLKALAEGHEADVIYVEHNDTYIKGTANYRFDKNGNKIGYIIVTNDVTEMTLEKNKIEEQRKLFDKILTSSPDLIWYKNAKGLYLSVNPRFSAIFGKSVDEVIGKTDEQLFDASSAEHFKKKYEETIASANPLYTEEKITFADGHKEILDAVRTPLYDSNGQLTGMLGVARNITARVEMETELRKIQIQLEQAANKANNANQHKGEFLARTSHEIRTPMNAIIGLTNIVKRKLDINGISSETELREIKNHINQIEISSRHLLGLINDILDISKIDAGKIELAAEVVDLPILYETVSSMIKPRCEEKNIIFETFFEPINHSTFLFDSLRLRQVLINLLGNSVKFTPQNGTITFSIKKKEQRAGSSLFEFSVHDTGIGIAKDNLEKIFQPFDQGDNKVAKQYGGTGLGLAISKRIVQLFGGDLTVESSAGKGSKFSFSIWLPETNEKIEPEEIISDATNKFKNKKALLVDDVEINRMIVASLLEDTGIEIDEEEDGLAALSKFEESPVGSYDIIFMDVQMPVMGGYEAAAKIRELERTDAKTIPIIAFTANAFKEDIDKALSYGMNAHITKPVELSKLLEVLFKFLK